MAYRTTRRRLSASYLSTLGLARFAVGKNIRFTGSLLGVSQGLASRGLDDLLPWLHFLPVGFKLLQATKRKGLMGKGNNERL